MRLPTASPPDMQDGMPGVRQKKSKKPAKFFENNLIPCFCEGLLSFLTTTIVAGVAFLNPGAQFRGISRYPFVSTKGLFQNRNAYQVAVRTILNEKVLKSRHPLTIDQHTPSIPIKKRRHEDTRPKCISAQVWKSQGSHRTDEGK